MFKFDRKIIKTTGWSRLTCVCKFFNKYLDWRKFAILSLLMIGAALLLLSCSTNKETDSSTAVVTPVVITPTSAATTVSDQTASTEETHDEDISSPINPLKEVAREDTLIVAWDIDSAPGYTNPWFTDYYDHQDLNAMMWEGLAYWLIFADESQPWLAERMEYSEDFTALTIKLRPEARWSDSTPVTSRDVVFTLEGHLNNDQLPYHAPFQQFVSRIEAIDDLTTVITFNQPAPRFAFEFLTLKFDTGIPIVPAHVLESIDDPTAYAGGLEMPHSGPYTTVAADISERILDLSDDWWAIEAGLIDPPQVKRIIMKDIGAQFGMDMDLVAEGIANNEVDTSMDLRPNTIANLIEHNPHISSHTGRQPPYGYLDWWPNSLIVNTLLPPYDEAPVRRAISLAIDRDAVDDLVYQGTQVTTIFPFPLYPGLQRFVDSPDVQALIEQYQPRKFDLDESARLMQEAGFIRNSSGLWERNGETVNATIHGFFLVHDDIAPVIEKVLLDAGFDASTNFNNAGEAMTDGAPGLYIFGHGASIVDPYATLELYHSRYSQPIGTSTDIWHLSRYNNPAYDALLDEMASLASDDPRFQELAVQAMEIYWRDQIEIPLIQWLHRIPYNQTYWTNWPTADNLGAGVNGAFWHHTSMLMITSLKKAH